MRVLVGMETSGALRRRFQAQGHDVRSIDVLPAEDDGVGHIVGDVFEVLGQLWRRGWWPDLGIFHPTCTYHTLSAAWAFKDPDFNRYPGVGYHQRVQPGTLVGRARREARARAEAEVECIAAIPIKIKVMENPRGTIPTRTSLGPPAQILQPYQFGDDASKATHLWIWGAAPIPVDPAKRVPGRMVPRASATGNSGPEFLERWSNQTDTGQNRLSPSPDRWKDRSRTYPGIADALAAHFGALTP